MCLVKVPTETKTITRRVVDQAATTRSEVIPATYKNIHVHKLVQPATQRTIEIPGKVSQLQHE